MGFVKMKANSKARVNADGFMKLKTNYLADIRGSLEEVPPCLVINWDHTGLTLSSWTMAKVGSKKVPITGVDDKRQITAVFATTMEGDFSTTTDLSGKENCLLTINKIP